ncbi:MAG: hypothetical protein LUG18_04015 [Candidatus Azobacteroides sp.]|nr:hypothetical protein [Candidatus Azobacteroides sp.]
MSDSKFLTFPIEFMEGAFSDIQKICNNIFDYAIYVHSLKYEKECDSDMEAMQKAAEFYEIELGNVRYSLNNGYTLYEEFGTKIAKASISKDIVFDYYKNKKTEFEIASFCGFCATKSILGSKTYCKTNKFLIHARMFGYNNYAALKSLDKKSPFQEKYFKRYNFDKLIKELQYNWGMNMISNRCRGFYISYEIGLEELAIISEKAKQKNKDKLLRMAKEEAIKKAMEIVRKENLEKEKAISASSS